MGNSVIKKVARSMFKTSTTRKRADHGALRYALAGRIPTVEASPGAVRDATGCVELGVGKTLQSLSIQPPLVEGTRGRRGPLRTTPCLSSDVLPRNLNLQCYLYI